MGYRINKAAIIGAGVMGSGIAALLSSVGVEVLLLDILPQELSDEEKAKGISVDNPLHRSRFALNALNQMSHPKAVMLFDPSHIKRIKAGNIEEHMKDIGDCDWIIEVVTERLEVKQALMEKINCFRKVGSIVSTNTSGVSVERIVENMSEEFKKNFLGTHFFNPPRYMRLFEMIPTKDTAIELVEFMSQYGENVLGKGVVIAKNTPCFIANRIGTFAYLDVMRQMFKFQYDIVKTDSLTGTLLGRPKSATFHTVDMVGLDILEAVSKTVIANVDSEDEKEQFLLPPVIQNMISEKALGNKTKKGFYTSVITDGKRQKLCRNLETGKYEEIAPVKQDTKGELRDVVYGETQENKFIWELVKNLLLYAAQKVPEIADDYKMIDQAMIWGYNWERGPFQIWDTIDVAKSVDRMKAEGCQVPKWIVQRLEEGKMNFYEDHLAANRYIQLQPTTCQKQTGNDAATIWDIGEDVLCLQFHSKGNSITQETVKMIETAVDLLEKDQYKGMVIGNQGRFFSAGASLEMIYGFIEEEKWSEMEGLISNFHQTMLRLKYASAPVVAAPFGMTLGGGAEIVLHSAQVLPFAEMQMGLVEAGVGLVPGAGGCKESLIRANERSSNHPMSLLPEITKTWQRIATASISKNAYDAVNSGMIRKPTKIAMNPDSLLEAGKAQVLQMEKAGYIKPMKPDITVLGDFGRAALQFRLEAMKGGGFMSDHDALIANKLAYILTGGKAVKKAVVSEEYILDLEKEAFLSLCGEKKTKERIAHMLATGKPLRN